jgi:nucleoside-diphosphate-sugar epimerase
MKKILITGGAGYIGSSLTTALVNKDYDVTVLDTLKYNKESLNHLYKFKNFKFYNADVTIEKNIKKFIKNQDLIIPLAALVGAPLCEKKKNIAVKTNIGSIKLILKNIKKNQKIIYPTTNSGYGIGKKNSFCDENSPINPISIYGRTKMEAEKIVLKHKNSISFRLATVFGSSYRMRTDLLVNNFVYTAFNKKKLNIFEPNFRRNYIHINDIVRAFLFAIKNFKKLKSEIFNLGLSSANITKINLAKKVKKYLPETKIQIIKNIKDPDQRDYYVSNKKIENKGFKAIYSLDHGIVELINIFKISKIKIKNNY